MPDWWLLIPFILLPGIAVAWFGMSARRRSSFTAAPDPDREVLRSLRQSGIDMTREAELCFFLYFPNAEQAQTATAAFPPPQWNVSTDPPSKNPLWKCTARTRAVPELDTIRELVAHCQSVAEVGGGEYDGWQIAAATTRTA